MPSKGFGRLQRTEDCHVAAIAGRTETDYFAAFNKSIYDDLVARIDGHDLVARGAPRLSDHDVLHRLSSHRAEFSRLPFVVATDEHFARREYVARFPLVSVIRTGHYALVAGARTRREVKMLRIRWGLFIALAGCSGLAYVQGWDPTPWWWFTWLAVSAPFTFLAYWKPYIYGDPADPANPSHAARG